MAKLYLQRIVCLLIVLTIFNTASFAQSCTLTATYNSTESRCAATGTIQVNAAGGSGNYVYKVSGPVVTNFTSSSLISGLSAGRYLVIIQDLTNNCTYQQDSVTVAGDYSAPTFTMQATDVTCINGNDGTIVTTSQTAGRSPFLYTIVAPSVSGVGTTSITGNFSGLISGNYLIQLSDSCGAIQTRGITIQNYDWLIDNYTVTKIGCDSINVCVNLRDNKGKTTPDSIFNNFMYGVFVNPGDTSWFSSNCFGYYIGSSHTVHIVVRDGCGNIKTVTWTDSSVPSIGAWVSIGNKACTDFSASIINQVNLTNPQFCLYNSSNSLLTCNSTGVFNNLPYGTYCIQVTNQCYDTIISRCFTVTPNIPSVGPWLQVNPTCSDISVAVIGQLNLTNPYYCLYDSSDVLITCDSSGVFSNIPFGTYCIKIFNDPNCYDTTITRCFTYYRPIPSAAANVPITNLACSTFTATITGIINWNNPQFCIYNASNVLITCNTTGVFDNLPYGTYCIDITNGVGCYDTTVSRCFTVTRPQPTVNPAVKLTNKTCIGFKASITGQSNLTDPQYCLYDSTDVLISCNSTGVFDSIPYGTYCIKIRNDSSCYDTTIIRCFTLYDTARLTISLLAQGSCVALGTTDVIINFSGGTSAYSIELYSPTGTLLQTANTNNSGYNLLGLPNLVSPLQYKVVVTDQCGRKDSGFVNPVASNAHAVFNVTRKCPSATWSSGSADVQVDLTNNNIGGSIVPVIIKKDGVTVSINANSGLGYVYNFLDLGPGTYIFDTYINSCGLHMYDTVVVGSYVSPDLARSAAYQCDNNSFSVGAVVTGGIAPYMFEIIGSIPSTPSIIAGPQSSPLFTINNGTVYSLIRLRATDACSNAGLNDVSVLPLANTVITATDTCFYQNITLSVDTVFNAVYTWYKRIPVNDSIIVGTGPSFNIPYLLPSDTGRYICKMSVNNGCLTQLANFTLTGDCGTVLPVDIVLTAAKLPDAVSLKWTSTNSANTREYQLERSDRDNMGWVMIGTIAGTSLNSYNYLDRTPLKTTSYYRLKRVAMNGSSKYSNIAMNRNGYYSISYYPNPVRNSLHLSLQGTGARNYKIEITDVLGKQVFSADYYNIQNQVLEFPRTASIKNGIYLLNITDLNNRDKQSFKLIYE